MFSTVIIKINEHIKTLIHLVETIIVIFLLNFVKIMCFKILLQHKNGCMPFETQINVI